MTVSTLKCCSAKKPSYEVEDIEPQEDGKPLYVVLIVVAKGSGFTHTLFTVDILLH